MYIYKVENIQPLNTLLQQIASNEYILRILSKNEVKIQPSTEKTYNIITKALQEKNTEFHTYKLKGERNFNVVLRGLHPSTPVEDIKEFISAEGHDVVNVCNIKDNRTKLPMPLFWVNLKPKSNNKEIYQLKRMLFTKVNFEPPKAKRSLPQCMNCQTYGHTDKFCHRTPRCVKCAGSHHTKDCTIKTKLREVKCVLCEGNHPANYKGCSVYKDLQKKAFPSLRKKELSTNNTRSDGFEAPTTQFSEKSPTSLNIPTKKTYSQVTKEDITSQTNPTFNESTESSDLKSMMKSLMQQIGNLLSIITTLITSLTK